MQHDDRNDGLETLVRYVDIIDVTAECPFKKKRRRGRCPTEIIIHHSWTQTVPKMISTLVKKGYGTHYTIDREGRILHLTPDECVISHCVRHNEMGIGIDLIRGEGQKILDCQYEALNRLLAHLIMRWNLGEAVLHKKVVFYHRDLRPTKCPGEIDDSKIHL